MNILHTDGNNQDFIELCRLLDDNLDEIVGGAIQREQYDQFNQRDDIHDVVMLYIDNEPIASGSFRHYSETSAEIKRIFVKKEFRGKGYSKIIMNILEKKALEDGYLYLCLETGKPLNVSMNLYQSIGFSIIDKYGPYAEMPESVCMQKQIK